MKLPMNPTIIELLTKINEHGYEAYLVGGAVRDAISNQLNKDFDLCSNIRQSRNRNIRIQGKHHCRRLT